jgi:hypothetical protein
VQPASTGTTWCSGTSCNFDAYPINLAGQVQVQTGPTGPQGIQGIQGPSGTVSVGTTTTGAAGSAASVTDTGSPQAAVINFTVPQGIQGIQGIQGPAATVAVGTVSALPAGSTPTVTNSGTSGAAVLNFALAQGPTGPAGMYAFPGTTGVVCSSSTTTAATCTPQQDYLMPLNGLDPTGATDNSAAINAFLTQVNSKLILPAGTYYTPSLSNTNGVPFDGDGTLLRSINQQATNGGGTTVTATKEQINSYSDKGNRLILGQEYLSHWISNLEANATAIGTNPSKVVFSGDSTTAGNNDTAPYFVDQMAFDTFQDLGIPNVSTVNDGHSGATSAQWLSTYLATDLALNPDVYVLRWGVNDANPATTIANMRTGLAQIRASHTVDQMTIILEMPSSTNDNPNGRNRAYYEQIRNGLVQAARDYAAVFVDLYGDMPDSDTYTVCMSHDYQTTPGPSTPEIQIHPGNCKNPLYNSMLMQALLPPGMLQLADNKFWNISSAASNGLPASTALPSAYPVGLSIWRAYLAQSAWPIDGQVTNFQSADGVSWQIDTPYNTSQATQFAMRFSQKNISTNAVSWSNWILSPLPLTYALTIGAGAAGTCYTATFTFPGLTQTMTIRDSMQGQFASGFLNFTFFYSSANTAGVNYCFVTQPSGTQTITFNLSAQ